MDITGIKQSIKDLFHDKFWIWVSFGFIIFLLIAFGTTTLIEYFRERGGGAVSVIFTPGRQSTENILGPLGSTFGLFSSMSAGMSFFILGRVHQRSKLSESFKRIGIVALLAFFLLIVGFFFTLYFIIFSNSTGSATSLSTIYILIQMFIVGLGFAVISLLSILKTTLRI